jgi:hypothetical protein
VAVSDEDRKLGLRAGVITLEIVDRLALEPDGPIVLTGLGAAVVVELDRFGATIEQFTDSLRALKARRDAEIARQRREN